MKKYWAIMCLLLTTTAWAQDQGISASMQQQMQKQMKKMRVRYGLKAGYNWSWITGTTANFNPGNRSGFMVGGFIAPPARTGFGFRSEIIFSRQGFSFDSTGNKINVSQDYIYLPQFTTFNITRFFQIQFGFQVGYLLNAKTEKKSSNQETSVMDYYNRFDYGFAGGVEINPYKGIVLGGRYNASLGNIYKQQTTMSAYPSPLPFDPSQFKARNAVVQFFVGYAF